MARPGKPNYEEITARIRAVGGNAPSTEDAVLFVADTLSTVLDGVTGGSFGALNTACQTLYSTIKAGGDKGTPLVPNPWFVMNGHEDRANPVSSNYLKTRAFKSIGGSALSLAGTAASAGTYGINVADIGIHANALGSTGAHAYKLVALAANAKYRQSVTIQDWLKLLIAMKAAKATLRAGSLVGGVVPGASLPAGLAVAVAKAGIKLTMTTACLTTAASIHWRAFQEQQLSGGLGGGRGGKVGPASQIYWEIFARRGVTRIFGQYDTAALVGEPGGWLALNDKLMLL